jgi:integrase
MRKMIGGKVYDLSLGVHGAENRKKAEKAYAKRAQELIDGHTAKRVMAKLGLTPAAPKATIPTLAEWWATYLTTYSPAKAENTQAHDEFAKNVYCAMRVGKTTFGAMPLDTIRQTDCLTVLQMRREMKAANPRRKNPKPISEGTVQRDRRLLQAIFERAVENDHITKNPWKGIDAKRDESRSHRILTHDDEAKLIAAFDAPVKDAVGRMVRTHPRYTRFVQFMLETGIRIDELLNDAFEDRGDARGVPQGVRSIRGVRPYRDRWFVVA